MRRTSSSAGVAISALLSGLLVVSGCSSSASSTPDPQPAVDQLVKGLQDKNVAKVHWDRAANARNGYFAVTGGLLALPLKVTAGSVRTTGNRATAALHWRWTVGRKTWAYTSHATLHRSGTSWRVHWTPSLVQPDLTSGTSLAAVTLRPARGDILGTGGSRLVSPRAVMRFGIDKSKVTPHRALVSARRLAMLLGIDPAAYAKLVKNAGPRAFVQALVLRRGQVPTEVSNGYPGIRGAVGLSDHLPLAPTKEFAAAVLGTVGPATAEIVQQSKGRVAAGDDVGLSGLEKRYDAPLSGTKGYQIELVGPAEKRTTLFTSRPVDGTALQTTLDPALQKVAQDALATVGPASALVAIQPSTGNLVAVASGPGSSGYNTATFGQYAPGSTFKMVSGLALLRSGLTPGSTVHCTKTVDVNGKTFKNYSDYPASGVGNIPLSEAFANSCNTAFINARGRLHGTDLVDAAAALGLGVDHDLGFPAYFGQVKPATGETEAAADMIGQGKDLASPMAMAAVTASVVAGHAVTPQLLPDFASKAGPPAHPLTAAEAAQLRTMMRDVVQHGSGALLLGLPGPPVIAKTGTAEYGSTPPLPTHAWMVAAQGDLAVAVFVDTGASGSHTAGPILKTFLQAARG